MPTTPNYGWDTPADTDYVTNGALAIRTMGDDIDASVYSIQTTLDAEKFDVAGGSMTGWLVLPTITGAARALGIKCDASGEGIIQFLNISGASQNGFIKITSDDEMTFQVAQSGNALTINNVGDTTRTHAGENRPIAFAMEVGRTTVSANSSATVTLNSGRFTEAPLVFITPERNTAASGSDFHSGNISFSSFKIYNNSASNWTFNWQAVQMTEANSEG